MKKIFILVLCLFIVCGCSKGNDTTIEVEEYSNVIVLDNNTASLNGNSIKEYDYVWHLNPNSENEYYEGDNPNDDIYIAHDIIYYPQIAEDSFTLTNYDGEMEWVSYYTNDELKDYIFSTLPRIGEDLPIEMMHSETEAYDNPVLHINVAGEYVLKGNWNGQIAIDLGEDAFDDENAKVTLILNGVDVTCSVAPSLVFYSVYEVDNTWEDKQTHDNNIDLSNAGAKVIISDGTVNSFTGTNVFRLLKPVYKEEGSNVQKKYYKLDGSFYSYESLLIKGEDNGTGILNITSTTYEGLDTELHLQIDSGNINIVSADDGINVNEDNVSVFKMNDGRLTIFAGQGAEGDVIDSNGYIVISGGTVLGTSPSISDEILDSSCGNEVSENATIISSGAVRNNMNEGMMPGGFKPDGFGPDDMPEGFDPNNRPDDFGGFFGGQEPPKKPN